MRADDPRHGTRAGYIAHRKAGHPPCAQCLRGRGRADKQVRIDHHRGARMLYSSQETDEALFPWLAMGVSYSAIGNAAGLCSTNHGSNLGDRIRAGHAFRRSTYLALAAVTETDLPARATVHADLTRTRIFSLMAAGHPLSSLPILDTGRWRDRSRITIGQARDIRDCYADLQAVEGSSVGTRTRARRAGHEPPAAWDDPGTLAWPLGWSMPVATPATDLDVVVVEWILGGEWDLPATAQERREVARRWHATGRSLQQLARLTGWKPERYFKAGEAAA